MGCVIRSFIRLNQLVMCQQPFRHTFVLTLKFSIPHPASMPCGFSFSFDMAKRVRVIRPCTRFVIPSFSNRVHARELSMHVDIMIASSPGDVLLLVCPWTHLGLDVVG